MQMGEKYGKLPHEFLYLDIADFSFDVAVTIIGNKKLMELQKQASEEQKQGSINSFADNKDSEQFTQKDFERTFHVTE